MRADKASMTKPRRILPNVLYFLTRCCSEQRFFLRPTPEVKQIFEYLLGLLAKKYEIQVHAYLVMSNHYHLVLTDTLGRLPDFQRDFNSLLARSINQLLGRQESFWDRRSYSPIKLLDDHAVVDRIAYTLANPVEERLVERARHWTGATSAGLAFGKSRRVARPSRFFDKSMPESVEIELIRPKCHAELDDEELLARIHQDVAEREEEAQKLGRVIGMSRVSKQNWRARPKRNRPRERVRPTVAGGSREMRMGALQEAKEWLRAYKDALAQFVAGVRSIEFPRGTWWMCVRLGSKMALE